jgi:hypothetical protein
MPFSRNLRSTNATNCGLVMAFNSTRRVDRRRSKFSFVDYLGELPYFCDEVLPRLAHLGVRHC